MGHIRDARQHLVQAAAYAAELSAEQSIRSAMINHIRQAQSHLVTYEEERKREALRDAVLRPNPLAEIRQIADELVRGLARLADGAASGTSVSESWCPEPQPGQTVPKHDHPWVGVRETLEQRQAQSRVHGEHIPPIIVEMDPPTLFPMVVASAPVWERVVKGEPVPTIDFRTDYTFSDPIVLVRGPHHAGRVAFCHVEDDTIRAYTVNVSRF